ncbi:MAG: hypothetical protein A3E82_09350 [Gammaproteobacteria bacterium RIFCSPHIGHO2_12_FULL_38_11]|nr:MAG: hypothetical protein A3E82_09350 [Gammaproteobacteria bacterium RIFCSPHIGHO2_12_FULL_38_11]
MKFQPFFRRFNTITLLLFPTLISMSAYADMASSMRQVREKLNAYTLDTPHWYVGANIGISHLRDKPNRNSGDNVKQNGPAGSVVAGYQCNSIWGAELGYTQYYNSKETTGGTIVAKTEHLAIPLALTGRYPLLNNMSALGKAGVAYSYAQKMAITSGVAKSGQAVSFYWGLGFDYSLTPKYDVIAQFAQAVGNHQTGSTDLWSLGLNVALV